MNYSDFRKGFAQRRSVNNGTATSSTAVVKLPLKLNSDNITAAHIINIAASQTFSADPTGSDVRRAIDSIVLELSGGPGAGTRISLDGYQIYDLARVTESQPSPDVFLPSSGTGGTATALWSIDVHHILDGARNDFQTAINTNLSTLTLTINFTTTANQLFTGGTASGAVSFTVDVDAIDYPLIPDQPNLGLIASGKHVAMSFNKTVTGAGAQDAFIFDSGNNKTRFMMMHAFDASGNPSDDIVDELELSVGNWIYKTTWDKLRQAGVHSRGLDVIGCALFDFGDDPMGFLPLVGVKDARIKWTALAAGTVNLAQDRQEPM